MGSCSARQVTVRLLGGPGHVAETVVVDLAQLDCDKLKIEARGGYEHFVREDGVEPPDGAAAVFSWHARTEIAE